LGETSNQSGFERCPQSDGEDEASFKSRHFQNQFIRSDELSTDAFGRRRKALVSFFDAHQIIQDLVLRLA